MIRDNVKLICKAKGMQLGDISDALKITRQTLHTYLTGRPTLETIERIAAVLGVPAFVLIHPAPLAALAIWNSSSAPAQAPGPAAVVLCPYCCRPIQIQTAPALATAGRPSCQNTGGDPDSRTDEGRKD